MKADLSTFNFISTAIKSSLIQLKYFVYCVTTEKTWDLRRKETYNQNAYSVRNHHPAPSP